MGFAAADKAGDPGNDFWEGSPLVTLCRFASRLKSDCGDSVGRFVFVFDGAGNPDKVMIWDGWTLNHGNWIPLPATADCSS